MDKYPVKMKLKRLVCYIVLIILVFICLFPFFILLINSTRSHPDIQKGFSFFPGKSFGFNLKNVLDNKNLPVLKGMFNSLFVAGTTSILCTYFSALTAYAIHAYNFKFKKAVYVFILAIMMVPIQVSTLGFVDLMGKIGLMDTFVPLIIPSIAAPIVFFFIKQYMDSTLPLEIVEAEIGRAHV